MEKQFNSQEKESYWYNYWLKEQVFEKCANRASDNTYCIMIPPPNVTGSLHMGHAFQDTLMDILIRHHAIKGDRVLWQVGTDHAGIATQMVVDRLLEAEGVDPKSLSREERIAKIWDWKEISGGTILSQLKRLGTAIDWNRERFTLDDHYHGAVQKSFVKLYRDGLIVKKKRLVNWDCHLKSAVSDLEVDHVEQTGSLYVIKYPIKDSHEFLSVATTRPETLFGDVAVAVHPEDERYRHLIGKILILPLTNREIPIVADARITPDFGTGCVKITPAHDFFDFDVAVDANLPFINILNADGTLNDQCGVYQGIDRLVAREAVLQALTDAQQLLSIVPHVSSVPICSRSNQRIEPYLTDQWYVTMKLLADRALKAYYDKEFEFVPNTWGSHYEQWLTGIQDWCISRQLIWGHRIPAWTDSEGTIYVGENEADVRAFYKLESDVVLSQDEDVLDTWFSSALWPFATLGWPDESFNASPFFPTSVLVSGFDIIFFWVARMVMFSLHFTGKIPFHHVYLHGIVQDSQGQKMSKSKGNVIDPIDLIDGIALDDLVAKRTSGLMQPAMKKQIADQTKKDFPEGFPSFGVDPLRMTFAHQASPGRFVRFDFKRLDVQQQTCHKLWNLMRFTQPHLAQVPQDFAPNHAFNQWILSRLAEVSHSTQNQLKEYRFDFYIQSLIDFMWSDVCDRYVELSKVLLKNPTYTAETQSTLTQVLRGLLCLLHPVIPFITEELNHMIHESLSAGTPYSCLLESNVFAKLQTYAVANSDLHTQVDFFFDLVKALRTMRSKLDIAPKVLLPIAFEEFCANYEQFKEFYESLAKVQDHLAITAEFKALKGVERQIVYRLGVPVEAANERLARFHNDCEKLMLEKNTLDARLSNPGFKERAPAAVLEKDSARSKELEQQILALQTSITELS